MSRYVTLPAEGDIPDPSDPIIEFHDDANVAAAVARTEARAWGKTWLVCTVLETFPPPAEPDLSTAE